MLNDRTLLIVRGCSGSGKSTFAKDIAELLSYSSCDVIHVEADQYFMQDNEYKFDVEKLPMVHVECRSVVAFGMNCGSTIILSNTSASEKELKPYLDLAKEYEYNVVSIILENRHGGESIHNVPRHVLERQEQRLRGSLKLR